MPHTHVALALVAVLGADASPPKILPRSSIAAVIARRGELGLDDGQVKHLAERDAALQARLAEIRERFGQTQHPSGGHGRQHPARSADGSSPLPSPTEQARDPAGPGHGGAIGGGRYGGGRRGTAGGHQVEDPSTRVADLQRRLDDADTQAWLEAESVLAEWQREPARAVAETYREALFDQREAASKKGK